MKKDYTLARDRRRIHGACHSLRYTYIYWAMAKGILSAEEILVCDPSEDCHTFFTKLGVDTSHDNHDAVRKSKYLLLAIKPQTFPVVADELRGEHFPVVISIMAGKTKTSIRNATGAEKVARVMQIFLAASERG